MGLSPLAPSPSPSTVSVQRTDCREQRSTRGTRVTQAMQMCSLQAPARAVCHGASSLGALPCGGMPLYMCMCAHVRLKVWPCVPEPACSCVYACVCVCVHACACVCKCDRTRCTAGLKSRCVGAPGAWLGVWAQQQGHSVGCASLPGTQGIRGGPPHTCAVLKLCGHARAPHPAGCAAWRRHPPSARQGRPAGSCAGPSRGMLSARCSSAGAGRGRHIRSYVGAAEPMRGRCWRSPLQAHGPRAFARRPALGQAHRRQCS